MEEVPENLHSSRQFKTLVLTDLCDSVALFERIGDNAAADLFRTLDAQVLQLLRRWKGRLIDRSDGMFLLFDAPVDGLGFALDYVDALDRLGKERKLPLRARLGMHVGYVLSWQNSEEAVAAGAKSLEVEGLAKPMAARLMALARPGQILLSAAAESMMRSAQRELGDRGAGLKWKSHGHWCFKGVPTAQEIFEVGKQGRAPLRMPKRSAKAWRDLPLWRRPVALVAEIAVLAVLAVVAWTMVRPEPAIAFAERDWVVMADLRNLTGQTLLDGSLEQAFRISLEQSRYVNVLSDLKARNTLQRMGKRPGSGLSLENAAEVALRDGARAVILPTVAELGGKVRVTAEVIDPVTQKTVYVEVADGAGIGSTLGSIDKVTARLRGRLGEAISVIQRNSEPLPNVSTPNLDALRAYAFGQKAYGQGRFDDAIGYFASAVALDGEFALAHMGIFRSYSAVEQASEGTTSLQKAMQLRSRLPPRDQLYLDGWQAQLHAPDEAYQRWRRLYALYPDYLQAAVNTAFALEVRNRFDEGAEFAVMGTSKKADFPAFAAEVLGRMHLARGRYTDADRAFQQAADIGLPSAKVWIANSRAARGEFAVADSAWPAAGDLKVEYFDRATIYLDQGRGGDALAEVRRVRANSRAGSSRYRQGLYPLAVTLWANGDRIAAQQQLEQAVSLSLGALDAPVNAAVARADASVALYAALLSQRMGRGELASSVLARLEKEPSISGLHPIAQLVKVVESRQKLLTGHPEEAVRLLLPLLDGTEPFQSRVALMESYLATGNVENAREQATWLASNRGRAYSEFGACGWCQQPLNVLDTHQDDRRMAAY